jgi:hypothetical protein
MVVAILLSGLIGFACAVDQKPLAASQAIEVYFSPKGGCQDAIVREITAAEKTIHVQAYTFTSAPIAKALVDAKKRGVQVEVIIDQKEISEKYCAATFFANQGVPVFGDGKYAIAHNKVMIIDGKTVITGSFNFTKGAEESNAENLLVIRNADLAAKYEKNYQEHLGHSVKYEGKAATSAGAPAPAGSATSATPPAATPVVGPKKDAPADDPIVYVTTSGKKYHAEGCRFLAKSSIPMKLSEAKAKGYTPCSVCNPPQ